MHQLPATELAIWVILYALAAARITRIITTDTITTRPRLAIVNAAGSHRSTQWAATLITCNWCAGFWVAAATTAAGILWHPHPALTGGVIILAVAHLAGTINTKTT